MDVLIVEWAWYWRFVLLVAPTVLTCDERFHWGFRVAGSAVTAALLRYWFMLRP